MLLVVGGLFLFVLPGIYLLVAYTFSYMLIVDRGYSAWQALEASRRVVNRNMGMMVGVASGAMMGLGLGTALAGCMFGVAYADIFGLTRRLQAPAPLGIKIGTAS